MTHFNLKRLLILDKHLKHLFSNKFFILSLVILVFVALFLVRIWRLTEAPPNVTGDEITYLNDVLHIIYSPDRFNPLSLMGYNLVSGMNFYVLALFVKAFPDQHVILGMRVASAVFSLG